MTNKLLTAAGVLSLALTAIHILGGGPDVHEPLLESNASDVVKGFASVVWHGITAALLMCSVMLLVAARSPTNRTMLAGLVIAYYFAFAILFLFYGITRLGTVLLMPPWIGFLVIVVVAEIGLRVDKRSRNSAPLHNA